MFSPRAHHCSCGFGSSFRTSVTNGFMSSLFNLTCFFKKLSTLFVCKKITYKESFQCSSPECWTQIKAMKLYKCCTFNVLLKDHHMYFIIIFFYLLEQTDI